MDHEVPPSSPSAGACTAQPSRLGTAPAILHQIRHALARLIATAETTCIDLAALPFGPGDQDWLFAALGRGEVRATIDALGETLIQETRFSGVWLVDYCNSEGERVGWQIEIAPVPQLLRAPAEDLPEALSALEAHLAGLPASDPISPTPL